MVKLKRLFALNPMATIAKLATNDVYASVEEFVANSYDADAGRVDVYVNRRTNTLTIDDDGDGMKPEDLVSFYQVGGSPKISAPISGLKKRVRIGKFGVGTILLRSLCRRYTLSTMKKGTRTDIKEQFQGELTEGEEIDYATKKIDSGLHGTTIVMRDLLFDEDEEEALDIDKLRQRLAWGFLPEDDFDIYLNGDIVVPKLDGHSEKFEFEISGKSFGEVVAEVFYANASSEHAGTHIYVNSRRVGRPEDFIDLRKIRQDFERRLIVRIKANGLNDAIVFNRDYFDTSHSAYVGLKRAVTRRLKEVKLLAEGKHRSGSVGKVKRNLSRIRTDVEATLNEKGIANMARLKRRGIVISFLDSESKDVPGDFNLDSGLLQLNLEHPSLAVTPDIKPQLYSRSMLALSIDTIAGALSNNNLNTFRKKCSEMWQLILDDDVSPAEVLHGLFPHKLYTFSELARYTNFGYPAWKRMGECGLVDSDKHDRVKGRDVNTLVNNELRGYVSIYDLVQRVGGSDETALVKLTRKAKGLTKYANQLVVDFGRNSPCYFFYDLCADYVYRILNESSSEYLVEFDKLMNGFFSVFQLTAKGDGMTLLTKEQINRVMGQASRNKIKIEEKFSRGLVRVKFSDFIAACQIGGS